MKVRTFPLAILAALATGFAARDLVSTAQAQTSPPPTAVCKSIGQVIGREDKAMTWMNEQLSAGRSHFVTSNETFCAW